MNEESPIEENLHMANEALPGSLMEKGLAHCGCCEFAREMIKLS